MFLEVSQRSEPRKDRCLSVFSVDVLLMCFDRLVLRFIKVPQTPSPAVCLSPCDGVAVFCVPCALCD